MGNMLGNGEVQVATGATGESPVEVLKLIFSDRPHLLDVVKLADLESGRFLEEVRERSDLFADSVKMFVVGRTSAGKTSLGNSLFGRYAMKSTGFMDCTDYLGLLRLKSNLWYFDTPGAGGDEEHENVTRLGLGLEQVDEPQVTQVELRDFTDAELTGPDGTVVGVIESVLTQDEWSRYFATEFAPDVIVYVIAPHMQFLRQDRVYLRDMLKRHREKVLIAFNLWEVDGRSVTTEIHLQDATRKIHDTYAAVFPAGDVRPHFVSFNALTGSGIHELASEVCQVIPGGKLGGMQAVLTGDLKVHAQDERSRRYRLTVNRIAARLALHLVDQRAGDRDLISVAARAVSQYGVVTFEGAELAAQINDDLSSHVEGRIRAVKQARQEKIIAKDVQTRQREIVTKVPILEKVETEKIEKRTIKRMVEESTGQTFGEAVKAYSRAARDHVKITFDGGGKPARQARNQQLRDELVVRNQREVTEEIEVPVKRIEQKVKRYEESAVEKINEVVGETERVVGTRALPGGISVIELLSAVGVGVEKYCTSEQSEKETAGAFVEQEHRRVKIALNKVKPELEELLAQGAEDKIADLLDKTFAVGQSGKPE